MLCTSDVTGPMLACLGLGNLMMLGGQGTESMLKVHFKETHILN